MLSKPDLSDALIASRLRDGFGITPSRIDFLPLGNDTAAFVYRVQAGDGRAYFLKARKSRLDLASALVPHFLYNHSVPQAVAPIPTRTGGFFETATGQTVDFTLTVYPYIDARDAMTVGMTDAQWRAYGSIVRAIHDTALPQTVRTQVPVETFELDRFWPGTMSELNARIDAGEFRGTPLAVCADLWQERHPEYDAILRRTQALGRLLQASQAPYVLCHADIHTANILIDAQGALHVVDWDQPVFAPKERDLMFVYGTGAGAGLTVTPHQHTLFMHGYGAADADIDWLALAYYRYLWVVQDVGDYAFRALLMDDATIGAEARAAAVRELPKLFAPGHIVDAAYRADEAWQSTQTQS